MSSVAVSSLVVDVFFCAFRKPLHKRADGKEVSQEENFLPKYQRVKDLCQRAEYQTSCQQPGQVLDVQDFHIRGFKQFRNSVVGGSCPSVFPEKCPPGFFQKWQCVEDPTGKLRLYKCKGMAGLYAPRMQALMARGASQPSATAAAAAAAAANSNSCDCANVGFKKTSVLKRKRMFTKKGTRQLTVLQARRLLINGLSI